MSIMIHLLWDYIKRIIIRKAKYPMTPTPLSRVKHINKHSMISKILVAWDQCEINLTRVSDKHYITLSKRPIKSLNPNQRIKDNYDEHRITIHDKKESPIKKLILRPGAIAGSILCSFSPSLTNHKILFFAYRNELNGMQKGLVRVDTGINPKSPYLIENLLAKTEYIVYAITVLRKKDGSDTITTTRPMSVTSG